MGEQSRRFVVSPVCYPVLYPELVAVAREKGYALAIHGSMTRDFDLIAVPWTREAAEPAELCRALREKINGIFRHPDFDDLISDEALINRDKLHGRLTCSIHLTAEGCHGPYIDLSIMPRTTSPN